MNDLRRELAPISSEAWKMIDETASRVLKTQLAARKLVDFRGPFGWRKASVKVGRVDGIPPPCDGVDAALRRVQPLVEVRVVFQLSRVELEDVARGAESPNLEPLIEAATRIAHAEDTAIFDGYGAAAIRGIAESSPHRALSVSDDYDAYPTVVAEAINRLRTAGVGGPYAIALGPRSYAGLMRTTAGFPLFEVIRRLVDGPIIWAPSLAAGVVMSIRGEDYELTVGQDLSIGYFDHSAAQIRLYFVESFTFRVITPEAAVPLVYGGGHE